MTPLISFALLSFVVLNAFLGLFAFKRCQQGCSYHLTRWLTPLGMFVWGDVLVIAIFWVIAAVMSWFFESFTFFLLVASTFWLVRSIGETVYWFLQQFAETKRDKPSDLVGYQLVQSDSIYFVYQVVWQCLTVLFLISTIYLTYRWLWM